MGCLPRADKESRKAVFLAEIETIVPWPRLVALIEPLCPKKDNGWLALAGLGAPVTRESRGKSPLFPRSTAEFRPVSLMPYVRPPGNLGVCRNKP
jgi:hypothetical protein